MQKPLGGHPLRSVVLGSSFMQKPLRVPRWGPGARELNKLNNLNMGEAFGFKLFKLFNSLGPGPPPDPLPTI